MATKLKSLIVENIMDSINRYGIHQAVQRRLMEQEQEDISLQEDLDYITELVESFKTNVYRSDAMKNLIMPDSRTIPSGIGIKRLMEFATKVYTDLKNKQLRIEKVMKDPNLTPDVTATNKAMLYQNLLYQLIQNKQGDFATFKGIVDIGVKQGKIDPAVAETWKSGWFDEADIQRRFDAAKDLKRRTLTK